VPAPNELQPVTAAGAPPILVIGNTGDPVTPFESAERVASSLQSGHLLTYAGTGHTTYGKDQCANAHIDSYLLDLTQPARAANCP
jgi:pimeloyl-ACP methyl ester carboxylesterase